MIFDEFLKGLIKHINAEAVIACHGLTSRSQPIKKSLYRYASFTVCGLSLSLYIFIT